MKCLHELKFFMWVVYNFNCSYQTYRSPTLQTCYSAREEARVEVSSPFLFFLGSRCYAHASPRARNISLSLGTKVEILWYGPIAPQIFSLRVDFDDTRKCWILFFQGISRFVFSLPPHTLHKHIVAVKATIDKQSPHGKLLFKSGDYIFETGSACLY